MKILYPTAKALAKFLVPKSISNEATFMKNNYYVYGLYSPSRLKGELFYIGKGTGRRAWVHYTPSLLKSNTHKNNIINNQRTYPMIRHGGLTEKFAHELEKCLIQLYKPQLTNKTDGGEGTSGLKPSKKTRNKISEANKGKVCSKETRNKIAAAQDRKPFFIKAEDGAIVLRAESTCCKIAQEFLGKSQNNICSLLTDSDCSLFFKVNNKIHYLEYENQTLEERAKLLGRNIASDLAKVKAFKSEITVEKDGKCYYLNGYKTYSNAGRQLGLSTPSELSRFCQMVVGKNPSVCGYELVTEP